MSRYYEVNADGNRGYGSHSATRVANVAAAWKRQGHNPTAYVVICDDLDRDLVQCYEIEVTTRKDTQKSLVEAKWTE